jgi:phage-related baseplate assembly protein
VLIAINVEITDTGEIGRDYITIEATAVISDYINNLTIGQDVIYNELVQLLMEVAGVYDVSVSVPSGNTSIAQTQIARTSTITITYAV